MVFRRTRRMILILPVVLQGGLLDGQLAVPPLLSQVAKLLDGRIAGRLGQQAKGIVGTYLDATDFHLQRVATMAPRKGIRRHAQKLLNCVLYGNWWNGLLARRVPLKNVVLPFDDQFRVAEAINGTQFEKLMCEVLEDRNTVGTTAVYAEPGVGKSVAAMLAVLQTSTSETCMSVILQGTFSVSLENFFRLQDASDAASVARAFFGLLQEQGIRLQIILDNMFDNGLQTNGEDLMMLTRAAHELGHHLIVITQSRERAEEVSDLNGARTRLALQQQQDERVYRWSSEQARSFLETLEPKESEQVIDKVLNDTQVPDEFRLWKPSDIREYLTSGCKPKAPQPARPGAKLKCSPCSCFVENKGVCVKCWLIHITKVPETDFFSMCTLQGASKTQTKAVWVRQLRQDCTRQQTCHSSRVDYLIACIGSRESAQEDALKLHPSPSPV